MLPALDETDKRILRLLQEDSRISVKEMAATLGLTPSPVYDRIRRLEAEGYIKRYVALLDKVKVGRPVTAFCQVSMRYHNEAFIEKFEQKIQELSEVQECYHMAGQVDFLLKIHVKSLNDYHDFVKYKLSKIDNIGVLNSTFVIKDIKHESSFVIE